MKKSVATALYIFLSILICMSSAFAVEMTLFGPEQYTRTSGAPDVFVDTFNAVPGQGTLIVKNGNNDGSKRVENGVSSATVSINGVVIFSPNDFNQNVYYMEQVVDLVQTNTLDIELASAPDSYITIEVVEDVPEPTVTISADPVSVAAGQSSTLTWSSTAADTASIDQGIGEVSIDGSTTVSPTENTTYTITATGPGGSATAEVTVTVLQPTTASLSADPETILLGASTTLTWNTTNAESISIDQGIGTVDANGSVSVSPTNTTAYTITASGPGGTATDTATITVIQPPTVTISADPDSITFGESATLSWSSTNADSCSIEPGIGAVDPEGSVSVSPTETTTYTITVTGLGGTASAIATVTYTNTPPVANSQSAGTDEDTACSITLTASDVDGNPLTYQVTIGPSNGTLSGTAPDLTYTSNADYSGQDSFTFIANDGTDDSGPATVTITVMPINDPPVANAGQDQIVSRGDLVTLNGSGSSDVDEDVLTYLWSFISTPSGSGAALSDPSAASPTFVPDLQGNYEIQLTVNDGTIASNPDTVAITVNPQMVPVPGVVGLTQAEAEAAIAASDLTVGVITTENSDTVPEGSVISQNPVAGTTVEEGSPVDLSVCLGPASPIPPTVSISASPETISVGNSTTLSWTSSDATSAYIDHGVGTVSTSGSVSVTPETTTLYTLTVTGPTGSASAQVQVHVSADTESQAEGTFGYMYNDQIPSDATIGFYDETRFALIVGKVVDVQGQPIEGVMIGIFKHPEYGTTGTNAEGQFTLPVEGGGPVTVVYQKQGLITSHRQVIMPPNDFAIADTVAMLAEDPASTTVTFDGSPETIVTHRSTPFTDEFGTRSATLVFTGDNQAYLTDENGNAVQTLDTISTRATVYPTPESMPAVLPPNSGFTYCVELAVDGIQRVKFNKPVITWIENYLGFDVGEIVPVGYYDRDKGVWVPSDNGVVVRLLDTNSDGAVDAVDADADGQADDLDADGTYSSEVIGLEDGTRYIPGATFWRVALTHFTPLDCNWPYGPPQDAAPPNPYSAPDPDGQKENPCNECYNSFVEERSRIFHEDIPIPGTDFTLHYASNRLEGYKAVINIPVSGATVPSSLKRIILKVSIAGRTFEQTLDPLPYQRAEILWDGLDCLGNEIQGAAVAHSNIGFIYDAVYYSAREDIERAFAQAGDIVTGIVAEQEFTSWKNDGQFIVTKNFGRDNLAKGWTISSHHQLYKGVYTSVLFKGDGSFSEPKPDNFITTLAGSGDPGGSGYFSGDGGPATEAHLFYPTGLAVDSSGNIYIADSANERIRKVDPTGIITTVVGNGSVGFSGDGGPAVEAQLHWPGALTVDASDNLYFVDSGNYRIRKVDSSGIITTVAGDGSYAYGQDAGVAVDSFGNLYIADHVGHRIRKLDPTGIITTVAGIGWDDFSGDGGPAVEATLSFPAGLAVDSSGNLYIADSDNHCIRKVDPSGIITTVAGMGGFNGYSGDYGPAVEATLAWPTDVAVDSFGNLYIADNLNNRIRKVDTNGIITTLAGNELGYSGDGGPAVEAQLSFPTSIAMNAIGDIYIADSENNRVRKIAIVPELIMSQITDGHIAFSEASGVGHVMSDINQHISTIDLKTGVALNKFSYNLENKLVSITDQFENTTIIERIGSGIPTAIISPDGLRTELTIDNDNKLSGITYPDGGQYDFEYTSDGLLTAKIDPNGNHFSNGYDSQGRLATISDEQGGLWQYSRTVEANGDILIQKLSAEGNLTQYLDHTDSIGAYNSEITGPAGDQTLYSRSADGLEAQKTLDCGMSLAFQYGTDPEYKYVSMKQMTETTPSGLNRITLFEKSYEDMNTDGLPDQITEKVTVNGNAATVLTDTLQSSKLATSPEGRSVTSLFDQDTLLTTSISIPGLFDKSFDYNTQGRLISISSNARQTVLAWNSLGNLSSLTDPLGKTTNYTYDDVGRVTAMQRPDGGWIGFAYDPNGNMTILTNPTDVDHTVTYNKVNLSSGYQTPISGSYSYLYDKDRNLIQTNFPSGKQINNIYTATQLTQIQTPEGSVDLTYSCGSKIESMTKAGETINYGYDGKLITDVTLSGTLNQSLAYTYNNDFEVTEVAYAGGTAAFSYDLDGLLTGVDDFTITRNADNGLPESVSGNGLGIIRTFNGYAELDEQAVTVSSQPAISWSLTRDNAGRIITKSETAAGETHNYEYGYDAMGRLLTVTRDGTLVEEYGYDLAGTRTSETNTLRNITERSLSYSDEDQLLTAGSVTYQYDPDGFLTTKTDGTTVTTYSYSSRGELLQVNLPDGRVITYDHDPMGRRIAKRIDGVIVEKYLWQGFTKLLAVFDGSDSLVQRFEYADGRMPVAMTQGGSTYFLARDQVGSLKVVTDASGNVVKRIDYDSFGNIIADSNSSFSVPFGFAGGLHDLDTKLVRFGYRDFDPDVGRWTAKDPILFAGGDTDLYGYVQNDPVNMIDPFGLTGLTTVDAAFNKAVATGNIAEAKAIAEAMGLSLTAALAAQGLEGPDDPTNPEQWEDWAKEHDTKVSDDTCSETRTPWEGPGKKFDPNEPPKGPWWKKAVWAAGRFIKLIKGWPH